MRHALTARTDRHPTHLSSAGITGSARRRSERAPAPPARSDVATRRAREKTFRRPPELWPSAEATISPDVALHVTPPGPAALAIASSMAALLSTAVSAAKAGR